MHHHRDNQLLVSFGSFGMPHYFWLAFIGLPLMFVGGVLCQFGFFGAVARFIAGESVPVAADTINYMAEETKGAVETVAKAAAKGVVEGLTRVMRNPARERIDL